jgi:NitT/TauT family transport system substrate-binding protein
VKRIVRAFNRGVIDAVRDPEAAVAAAMRRDSSLRREVELSRLTETLRHEMNHAERAALGIGDASDARLSRAIAAMVETKSLPRTPATRSIFTRAFLPPKNARLS